MRPISSPPGVQPMSEYLGVITWNVKGDLSTSGTAGQRVQDLNGVLAELAGMREQPVDFICLQETSGNNGALKKALEDAGYTCYALREGDGQGDYYVFAASPGFTFDGPPEQCLFEYESPSGSPLRYPAVAKLTRVSDGLKVAVCTYHASLDGGLLEGLVKCSEFAVDAAESRDFNYVLVAGDLNITTGYRLFDPDLGKEVYLLNRLFQGFAGVSENLDHAFCRPDLGLRNIDGGHFATSSDHELLYGRFKIG